MDKTFAKKRSNHIQDMQALSFRMATWSPLAHTAGIQCATVEQFETINWLLELAFRGAITEIFSENNPAWNIASGDEKA